MHTPDIDETEVHKMKTKIITALISVTLMAAITVGMTGKIKETEIQKNLAKEIFRFHVLANSDSQEDQQLKMKVKDHIVSYMKEQIPHAESRRETKRWAEKHLNDIEKEAEKRIQEEGYDYRVKAKVENCAFPEKTYGDLTFPAGNYEALRIMIGQGKGRNWWCVLYPELCFLDSVRAVVPEEGKTKLKDKLTYEEYHMISTRNTFKIKWFFLGKK